MTFFSVHVCCRVTYKEVFIRSCVDRDNTASAAGWCAQTEMVPARQHFNQHKFRFIPDARKKYHNSERKRGVFQITRRRRGKKQEKVAGCSGEESLLPRGFNLGFRNQAQL